jgi:hypothetical protein
MFLATPIAAQESRAFLAGGHFVVKSGPTTKCGPAKSFLEATG